MSAALCLSAAADLFLCRGEAWRLCQKFFFTHGADLEAGRAIERRTRASPALCWNEPEPPYQFARSQNVTRSLKIEGKDAQVHFGRNGS